MNNNFLKMTKKELYHAAKFGYGRAIIFLKSCENKEKYSDIIHYLITNDNAFDSQLYGTQSFYCYELINCFENKERFLNLLLENFAKSTNNVWLFLKHCELLSDFALDGSRIAKESLYEKAEYMLKKLSKKSQ